MVLQILLAIILQGYSFKYLPIEETLTFQNAIILITSVFNKNKNSYYHIFLEKASYEDKSNTQLLNACLYIINAIFWIEMTFLKELIIGISEVIVLSFSQMSAIDAMIYY